MFLLVNVVDINLIVVNVDGIVVVVVIVKINCFILMKVLEEFKIFGGLVLGIVINFIKF